MELRNKVAVIAGGASGLGRRTAEYFVHEKGARVAILDLDETNGESLAALLGEQNAIYCHVDVSDEASVAAGIASVIAKFGAIHACINCAGVPTPMKILDREGKPSGCARFAKTLAINLAGTFNVMAHCIEHMVKNPPCDSGERGVVINVASAAAFEGQVGQTAYASSKAGVVALSLPAARELSAVGIRVNSVAPGLFNTPMAQSVSAKVLDSLLSMIEFPKRFGDMTEFASLCAYLCENAYINGECIRLDAATRLRAR
ncbi:MAG TPA: SDR family NAD(P)-dependent oxidoreductase [Steroidobacter sp.]|uniref:SDR family NAD(P)-dependent oxidoreductase n=1 Tax=Steroidobacter sp. TaxID=1978227 RepID=UPI002EDA6E61